MLRLGHKTVSRLQHGAKGQFLLPSYRLLSGNTNPSSSTSTLVAGAALLVAGCGGTVVYAKVNPKFRQTLENNVPPARSAFELLLGPVSYESNIQPPIVPPKIKKKIKDPMEEPFRDLRNANKRKESQEKPVDGDSANKILDADKPQNETLVEPLLTVVPSLEIQESKDNDDSNHSVVEPVIEVASKTDLVDELSSKDKEQERPALTETSLDPEISSSPADLTEGFNFEKHQIEEEANAEATVVILDDMLNACSIACSNAIIANIEAANNIALHSSLLRVAADYPAADAIEKSQQWEDVAHALTEKEKSTQQAELAYQAAMEELAKMRHALKDANCGDTTSTSSKLIEVDRDCMSMSHDLEEAKGRMLGKEVEASALRKYLQQVEVTKEKFRLELEANLPEFVSEPEWKKTNKTRSQENSALLHMQHQVEELQKELAEERSSGADRLEDVVSSVRSEVEEHIRKLAEMDLNKKLEEQKLCYDEQIAEMRKTHENEMRKQLKRQASVHVEHLSEALSYMERQTSEKYEKAMNEELEQRETMFQQALEAERTSNEAKTLSIFEKSNFELETAFARLRGIEQAVDGRAHIENVSRKAQELSLACDALLVAIRYGDGGKPVPLSAELDTVKAIYKEDPTIDLFSGAVPMEAVERGVYTEEVIRSTFQRIGKICRRVSLVDENRNSLFIFFMSYLKSLLTVSNAQQEPPTEINQSQLDVFSIISYANYCLQRGNLEQAIRFVNQLTGEPRKVAEDWIREARLLLETRQAIEALAAVSQGLIIGAQLEK